MIWPRWKKALEENILGISALGVEVLILTVRVEHPNLPRAGVVNATVVDILMEYMKGMSRSQVRLGFDLEIKLIWK